MRVPGRSSPEEDVNAHRAIVVASHDGLASASSVLLESARVRGATAPVRL